MGPDCTLAFSTLPMPIAHRTLATFKTPQVLFVYLGNMHSVSRLDSLLHCRRVRDKLLNSIIILG